MATHQKKHIKNNHRQKELIFCSKDDSEFYGQITAEKGDMRFEVKIIQSNILVIAKATGRFKEGPNRERLNKNDYILLQKDMSTIDNKYYILRKYSLEEVKKLKKSGELAVISNDQCDNENNNINILFEGDILLNKIDEIEINDDFIAGI
jgi:translation initiation factor IF-1